MNSIRTARADLIHCAVVFLNPSLINQVRVFYEAAYVYFCIER